MNLELYHRRRKLLINRRN